MEGERAGRAGRAGRAPSGLGPLAPDASGGPSARLAAMQHLRIVTPTRLVSEVLAALRDDAAITSLTHVRGASLDPPGDVIEADVAREAVNDVVERLHDTGVHLAGTIHIQPVTTWLS